MEVERSLKTNGYKIRSWGDLAALATVVSVLLALFIGVLLWGLKLEGELNGVRNIVVSQAAEIAELKAQISQGILPRADEQNRHQEGEIAELKRRVERLEDR